LKSDALLIEEVFILTIWGETARMLELRYLFDLNTVLGVLS